MGDYWSIHTHSKFSALDGMSDIGQMVERAAKQGMPAMALTDHGNLSGTTQLYVAAKKHGIVPFPGVEAYLIDPRYTGTLDDSGKEKRFHLGIMALNARGYQALVKYVSLSHSRPRFNRFPRLTIDDLASLGREAGKDVAITTGCYFGFAQQMLVETDDTELTRNYVKMLAKYFPNTYVELQNHNISHDQDDEPNPWDDESIVEVMYDLAGELSLPVLAGQDSHYLLPRQKDAHALMKRMVYGSVEDAFPGDSFHLASEKWVSQHYDADVWEDILDGHRDLLDKNTLSIPALDSYRPRVPTVRKGAMVKLRKLVYAQHERHKAKLSLSATKDKLYIDRLESELDVIAALGQANYLLLWVKVVEWCRMKEFAIEARGSGNGSLVNYYLGITQVDPIQRKTVFERFLSIDRIKPPDIDLDVEDVARQELVHYIGTQFDSVQIGTYSNLGATTNTEGDERGSVLVSYKTYLAREAESDYIQWRAEQQELAGGKGKRLPDHIRKEAAIREADAKADKDAIYASIQTMEDVGEYFPDDVDDLRELAGMGVYRSYGVHAAGILLSGDDLKIKDWVPTMLVASSNTTVSMYDMDDVEQWGLLKLDILGQRSLAIMRRCQQLMGRENPTDFEWIPDNDTRACTLLRTGKTDTGIFHFEGYTKAKGGREMGIRSTADAILATALYMPGAMNTGQTALYLDGRKNPAKRKALQYVHPIFEEELGHTYGAVVFQEQVLSIMRKLGMDIASINALFKVVKDSGVGAVERNAGRIAELRAQFDEVCEANGIDDSQGPWDQLTGIVSYAFNGAHAAGYGIRSYRTAYLKAHYPLEFMTALMECNAGTKKEDVYMREVRRMKIDVLGADINVSGKSWSLDKRLQVIRRGLVSIRGVGDAAAVAIVSERDAGGPYKSIEDLATRVVHRSVSGRKQFLDQGTFSGTIKALADANALKRIK